MRAATLCIVLVLSGLTAAFAQERKDVPTKTIFRIDQDGQKLDVKVGDIIEIDLTYPVVPTELPTKVTAESDSRAVKILGTANVQQGNLIGVGRVAGVFTPENVGKATLTLTLESKSGKKTRTCAIKISDK